MSLVGLALRISAKRAVEAAGIFPEGRVYDSAFLPVDEMADGDMSPFFIVSTETVRGSPAGRDLNNGDRELELLIEIALTRAISVSVPDGEDRIELALVETDAGLEASIAILERQVMACLFGRGGGAWGDVFRKLCSQIKEAITRRAVSGKEGARFCARQILLSVQPIAEPPFAAAPDPGSPLADFLALAEADPELGAVARMVREAIEGKPQDWPAIYSAAAVLGGYTDEEAGRLGLTVAGAEGIPEPRSEIVIEGDDGASFTITEEEADAQFPEPRN